MTLSLALIITLFDTSYSSYKIRLVCLRVAIFYDTLPCEGTAEVISILLSDIINS